MVVLSRLVPRNAAQHPCAPDGLGYTKTGPSNDAAALVDRSRS